LNTSTKRRDKDETREISDKEGNKVIKIAHKTTGKRTKNRNNSIIQARPSEISIEITAHAEENKRL
jgi:hypothetical protein